ncbi:hypothetical protein H072_7528 [Dactylellina haptotyla CBS 200.50]|uniref:uracil phosphoribosyltransferase n=1 Tax=Dactylellina haptotyla (strain CBS 200.50) TaxID=1284197 RepID=S8BHE3_DACHA|nr:hypothetical protein H072_7528 [Dactylellina haptotyla CBS 200.50]
MSSKINVSSHPCVRAKLSQLRSSSISPRETRALVHEIATFLAAEALANNLTVVEAGQSTTALGADYTVETVSEKVVLVPILRSGLGMIEAFNSILPTPAAVHHLGLFREKVSLSPVEYYNNLPASGTSAHPADIAIICDPVIATGGTAVAAIQTLRDWGVKKIILCSILGAKGGVEHAANEWPEGVEVYMGAVDPGTNEKGMIVPGLGDIGDRLFLTIGK